MSYLELKNYYKSFNNTPILKNINMQIEKGSVVSLIGKSGSGKTTLLRTINFLENADEGVMILDNEVLFDSFNKKLTSKQKRLNRRNFSLVFQSFNLFPQYNVLDNVTLAPKLLLKEKIKLLKKKKTPSSEIKDFIKKSKVEILNEAYILLDKVGLSDKIKSYPSELSGGQCQRVAIARALAIKPKILCFDEPTSALDPNLTNEVLNVIKTLKDGECTMIIVTHELGFAKAISDKVIFMDEGIIVEEGSSDILLNPQTEKLANFLSNTFLKENINE